MPRSSDPRKLALWRERFERFAKAGLSVAPFCAAEGISAASYYNWRKKLGKLRQLYDKPLARPWRRRSADGYLGLRNSPAKHGRFQQVAVASRMSPMLSTVGAICIALPCGTRIQVDAADLDALRAVIAEVMRADFGHDASVA